MRIAEVRFHCEWNSMAISISRPNSSRSFFHRDEGLVNVVPGDELVLIARGRAIEGPDLDALDAAGMMSSRIIFSGSVLKSYL